jgi:hypothetical protein
MSYTLCELNEEKDSTFNFLSNHQPQFLKYELHSFMTGDSSALRTLDLPRKSPSSLPSNKQSKLMLYQINNKQITSIIHT